MTVWDLARGRSAGSFTQAGTNDVVFSSDSASVAAAGSDGTILVIEPSRGTSHAIHDQAGRVQTLVASPDGASFASCGDDGAVRVRSWANLEARVVGQHGGECELAWSARRATDREHTGTDARLRISSVSGAPARSFPMGAGGHRDAGRLVIGRPARRRLRRRVHVAPVGRGRGNVPPRSPVIRGGSEDSPSRAMGLASSAAGRTRA